MRREYWLEQKSLYPQFVYRACKKPIACEFNNNTPGPKVEGKWRETIEEAARDLRQMMDDCKYLLAEDNTLAYHLGKILKKYDWKPKDDDFDFLLLPKEENK